MMQILIATGGSEHSNIAVKLGGQVALQFGGEITLLTVIKHEKLRERGEKILADAVVTLLSIVSTNVPIHTKLRVGQSAEQIVAEAEAADYNLIVLGESTHHDLLSRIVGPTAKRVVEQAGCPTLIAKGDVNPIHNILLCDSGLRHPALLARLRKQMPHLLRNTAVSITVLHVMSQISAGPGVSGQQLRADASKLIAEHTPEGVLLTQDLNDLSQEGIAAQPKVRHGFVVDEIVKEMEDGGYDLVVIGSHQNEGWQRFLLDDLASQIVLKSNHPILIIQ